jgi:hypothetical protein
MVRTVVTPPSSILEEGGRRSTARWLACFVRTIWCIRWRPGRREDLDRRAAYNFGRAAAQIPGFQLRSASCVGDRPGKRRENSHPPDDLD